MSEGLITRVYLVLMCMNIALIVFGGVTIYKNPVTKVGDQWNMTIINTTDSVTKIDVVWDWIFTGLSFILLGGIVGMFAQAGLPIEVQMMIGVPITALGLYAMYTILKAAAQAVGGAIGGVLGILGRLA